MSAQPFGGPVIVPASAKSLQELLGARVPQLQNVSELSLRADIDNAGIVWLGLSDVTPTTFQLGFMLAGEPVKISVPAAVHLEKIFLVGNGSDKVYVSGVCL